MSKRKLSGSAWQKKNEKKLLVTAGAGHNSIQQFMLPLNVAPSSSADVSNTAATAAFEISARLHLMLYRVFGVSSSHSFVFCTGIVTFLAHEHKHSKRRLLSLWGPWPLDLPMATCKMSFESFLRQLHIVKSYRRNS
jgi:hypothetical protein